MAVLVVSVTIPCLVMTGLQYKMAREDIAKEELIQQQLSESTGKALLSRIKIAQHLLLTAVEFVKIAGLQDTNQVNKFLDSLRANFPDFLNIHIDNERGFSVAFSPESNSLGENNIGIDHKERDHWLHRSSREGVRVSGLVNAQGAATGNIINVSAPIIKDGELKGYAVAAVNLTKLAEQVLPQSFSKKYEIAIADGRGKIIFSTANHMDLPHKFPIELVKKVKRFNTVWTSFEFDEQNEDKEMFQAYLSSVPEAGWLVGVVSSQKDKEQVVWNIVLSNGLVWLSILLLTAVASVFVSRPLVESISKLSSQISAGRTRPSKEEIVTGPKELKMLQHKFSIVSSQLNRANADLSYLNSKLREEVEFQVKKLTEREVMMISVFKGLSEGLLLCDGKDVVRFANEAAVRILGKEFTGKPLEEIFAQAANSEGILDALKEVKYETADKTVLSLQPFILVNSGYLKKGLFIRDVTSAEQLNRLKDDLIGVVAHELKSPLSAIRLQAEEIRTLSESEGIKEKADNLIRDSDSMKKLIESWLDVSRLEAGAYRINKELCLIAPLIKKAVRISSVNGVFEFELHLEEAARIAWIDREAFVQVMTNLLSNSVRYADPERHPRILLEVRKEDKQLLLRYSDNGIGIEPSKVDKVFEKFYQVEMNTKRKPGGTGLGLVIVKGLIELHGGSVRIKSIKGEGTTFIINFPYPEV